MSCMAWPNICFKRKIVFRACSSHSFSCAHRFTAPRANPIIPCPSNGKEAYISPCNLAFISVFACLRHTCDFTA
uniref:Uncharacterized protein n=1 Tax=Myoviridae sp. ctTOm1 TaxID=2826657 RepID=A0A8S5N4T8_9CAUD|nr:MAG TPA: hypothetical protein [Myoviridae sp. ctTOm1]